MLSEILVCLLLFLLHILYKYFRNHSSSKRLNSIYQQAISLHLQKRDSQIVQIKKLAESVHSEKKSLILQSTWTNLRELFLSKKVTSREILLTYGEKSSTLGKDLSLIADLSAFFPALEQADKADILLRSNPSTLPPLLGLPFSVKEQLSLKHSNTTCGYAAVLSKNTPSETDSLIIQVLRKAGAIPFLSSNVPQSLFSIDTDNNIYGHAKNPLNPERIVGGSSGGEAGLISGKCSPIGIASDAAGSIRMPANFCGVYGFKPTPRRISIKGRLGVTAQEEPMRENPPTIGPIGQCVDDLIMMMRCIFGKFEQDPQVVPMKFQESALKEVEGKKLKIGFIESNEFFESCSGVKYSIKEVCDALRKNQHEVVEFKENVADKLLTCLLGISGNQTGKAVEATLNQETPMSFSKSMIFFGKIPSFFKRFLAFLLSYSRETRLKHFVEISGRADAVSLANHQNKKDELKKFFFEYWVNENFDALITPVFPIPAPKLGETGKMIFGLFHNLIGNFFEMPCGTIPVRKMKYEETLNYSDKYSDSLTLIIKQNLKGSEGLPVGVNVYCKPYEDEKTLGVMKIIEDSLKNNH